MPVSKTSSWLGRPRLVCFLLALSTLVLFWPVHRFTFLNYDDTAYVTSNRHVLTGLTPENLRWAFHSLETGNWHPLTWMSHMLDVTLFGPTPAGPHVINLLLHVINTVLLFLLLRELTGARGRSALVAALFAWHPLHVESVAWISERKDVLSGLFGLLCLLAYTGYCRRSMVEGRKQDGLSRPPSQSYSETGPIGEAARHVRRGHGEGGKAAKGSTPSTLNQQPSTISAFDSRPSTLDYFLCLVFFALGLMSKPMLVSLPFVLLLLDFWPLHRLSFSPATSHLSPPKRLVLEKIPFFILGAVSCVVTFVAQQKGGAMMTMKSLPFLLRVENAFVAYLQYVGKLFWPVHLVVPYPYPNHWPWFLVFCGVALVLGLSTAAIRLRRSWPFLFTGWFWFLGMLIPVIGLVQVGPQSMADRYMYLPIIGLLIAFSWGAAKAADSLQLPATARWVGVVVLAASCAGVTAHQLLFWQDSGSLFRHALDASTDNYVAHDNLSEFLYEQGAVDEAMEHCYQATLIQPNDPVGYDNVGHGQFLKGNFPGAIESFRKAIELNPRYAGAWRNLGSVFLEQKDYDRAQECYEAAIRLQPDDAEALNDLGGIYVLRKQFKEAIASLQTALRFQPEYTRAHVTLANALVETGNTNGAVDHLQAAVRLDPEDLVARLLLARVLCESGRNDEGIANYQEALRLNPGFVQARAGMAAALAAKGSYEAAIGEYEKVLKATPDSASAHYELGCLLAGHGRTGEAVEQLNEAVRLKPDYEAAKAKLEALTAGGGLKQMK